MRIFAISDLHLSCVVDKPMTRFGDEWTDHFEKIQENWKARVTPEDVVLLGGDISWALKLEEALPDYNILASLPGHKIVLRGNHDYYWSSLSKMQTTFPEFCFLQNNCFRFENFLIAGSRGWTIPSSTSEADDIKIYKRELDRLRASLNEMVKIRQEGDKVIALLHYPPFDPNLNDTDVTKMLEEFNVDVVTYGHLHGKKIRVMPEVKKNGIRYLLTSSDLIKHTLVEVF